MNGTSAEEKYETTAEAVADLSREIAEMARMLGRAEVPGATEAQRCALEAASADAARIGLALALVFPEGGNPR
ncbi:MAG: hypothetical protein ACREU5_06810 [Burkholderiales bacterium]